jgi:gas vesicle protein
MGDKAYAGEFMAGFVIGVLVGAAATILLAPQSGEETRSRIREKGVELGRRAEEIQIQARERADTIQSQARERADTIQSQAREKADEIQSQAKNAIDRGKTAAAEKRQELLSQLEQETAADEASA